MSGFYAKAQYKFDATRRNEVSLRVNDVAFVVQTIDANWYYGIVHKLAGNFPINFVQTLQLPLIRDGEKLFAGIGNFDGQVKGDLSFTKGTRIIQLRIRELQFLNSCYSYILFPTALLAGRIMDIIYVTIL